MVEFQYPGLDGILREVCREHHYQLEGHSFVISGICEDCNKARVTKRRLDLV